MCHFHLIYAALARVSAQKLCAEVRRNSAHMAETGFQPEYCSVRHF